MLIGGNEDVTSPAKTWVKRRKGWREDEERVEGLGVGGVIGRCECAFRLPLWVSCAS